MKQALIIILLLLIVGCQKETNLVHSKSTTLAEAYPGNILQVDKIELLDGTTGERRIIEDTNDIMEWITLIKDIKLMPDETREGGPGFKFGLSLYSGEGKMLQFTPNQINNVYYQSSPELERHVKALFEEQFGRAF
jgi:hypothetical protein